MNRVELQSLAYIEPLTQACELMHGPVIATDEKSQILYINNEGSGRLGYTQQELQGKSICQILCKEPCDLNQHDADFFCRSKCGQSALKVEAKCRNETWIPIKIKNRQGKIQEKSIYTFQIKPQNVFKHSSQMHKVVHDFMLEQPSYMYAIYSSSAAVMEISPSCKQILGYEREELKGKTMFHIVHPEDREASYNDYAKTLKGENLSLTHRRLFHKDGNIKHFQFRTWWEKEQDSESLKWIMMIGRDVTETMEKEVLVKDVAEAERRRHASLSAWMAHEVRSPANDILIGLDLLLEGELNAETRIIVDKLQESGNQLLVCLNDQLDFEQIQQGHLKLNAAPFLLFDLLQSILKSKSLLAQRKEITLSIDNSDGGECYIGDVKRIRQVILNLTSNALHFTPPKGEVTLRAFERKELSKLWLRIEVIDTGPGIKLEDIDKLFQPFSQLHSSNYQGGSGLGLSICKSLVEMMGGTINVKTDLGSGSTFYFEVPLEKGEKASVPALVKPAFYQNALQNVQSLLLIDDNQVSLFVAQKFFQRLGVKEIDQAHTVEIAQEKLKSRLYDFALIDWNMPTKTGGEVIDALREWEKGRERRQRFFVCTAMPEGSLQDVDCEGYFYKPVKIDEIVMKFKKALGSSPKE